MVWETVSLLFSTMLYPKYNLQKQSGVQVLFTLLKHNGKRIPWKTKRLLKHACWGGARQVLPYFGMAFNEALRDQMAACPLATTSTPSPTPLMKSHVGGQALLCRWASVRYGHRDKEGVERSIWRFGQLFHSHMAKGERGSKGCRPACNPQPFWGCCGWVPTPCSHQATTKCFRKLEAVVNTCCREAGAPWQLLQRCPCHRPRESRWGGWGAPGTLGEGWSWAWVEMKPREKENGVSVGKEGAGGVYFQICPGLGQG